MQFVEALHDPSAALTLLVLTGARKQSVVDAEHLFSLDLAEFLQSRGYEFEARFISVIELEEGL